MCPTFSFYIDISIYEPHIKKQKLICTSQRTKDAIEISTQATHYMCLSVIYLSADLDLTNDIDSIRCDVVSIV